jgi:S-DNA-T family DNA segregation ATPase FtsK/SpoIIIE
MAKKNKNKKEARKDRDSDTRGKENKKETSLNPLSLLREETVRAIVAIVLFLLALFFILSALGKAGLVGEYTFSALKFLLGIGYILLPLTMITAGVLFLLSLKRNIALTQAIGSSLLLLSLLGIIDLAKHESGGWIGKIVAYPLVSLFDYTASYVILVSLSLIAILVVFDTALSLSLIPAFVKRLFGKKEITDDEELLENAPITEVTDAQIKGMPKDAEPAIPEKEVEKVEAQPTQKKLNIKNPFGSEKVDEFGFAPASFNSKKEYTPPPLTLLEKDKGKPGVGDIKANANIIQRTLMNFGIPVEMDEISIGPSVTRYALKPAEGVKLSRIVALQNDLALALAAHPLRIEAPIPGKSLVGIEIPNTTKTMVGLGSLLSQEEYKKSEKALLIGLGKAISGLSKFTDVAKAPHMLIAGTTGSGKSVMVHTIVTSLLYRNSPEQLKFIMIDPKRVELTLYNKIPHLLTPVITDPKKAIIALKWAAKEMDRRYDILEKQKVRDIGSYHKNIYEPYSKKLAEARMEETNPDEAPIEAGPEPMPYIVVIIDELADIMQAYPRELEAGIVRLAQMSRAVGIHLILSTQRPSVNVITGLIKANVPSRVAFQVASQIDSRTIIDMAGAEKLLGAGDMLYLSGDMSQPLRIQSAFISETEVKNVVNYIIDQFKDEIPTEIDFAAKTDKNVLFDSIVGGGNGYDDDEDEDELYEEAREIVLGAGKASTSFLQRKLRIGYARAARLIDILEERGVVSAGSGAKPREVLGSEGGTTSEELVDSDDLSAENEGDFGGKSNPQV